MHSASLLYSYRGLLLRVARTELAARYAGSLLGCSWSVLAPLSILAIYAVVYVFVLQIRPEGMTSLQYTLYIFCGLVPYLAVSEAVANGAGSVVSNRAVLTNTVFPIDLAPAKAVILSQGTMIAGFALIFLLSAWTGMLHWTALLLPVWWILLMMFCTGINWILSLLNVVLRDLQNIVTLILMVMMIASPIAYTPGMVPAGLRPLVVLNPFAYFVLVFQKTIALGQLPTLWETFVVVGLSIAVFFLGGFVFHRGKRVIIDHV